MATIRSTEKMHQEGLTAIIVRFMPSHCGNAILGRDIATETDRALSLEPSIYAATMQSQLGPEAIANTEAVPKQHPHNTRYKTSGR